MLELEQAARAVTRAFYRSQDIRPALSVLVEVLAKLDKEPTIDPSECEGRKRESRESRRHAIA